MRTIFYATTVTLLIAAAACSDNTTTKDAGPGNQLCPTTIVEATSSPTGDAGEGVTNKCHVDQYICVVGFQCGNFTQQSTCTCDGTTGKFSCVLANGQPVPDGVTDPTTLCLPTGDGGPGNACPTDKTKADNTPCSNAGQQCYYSTTCTNPPRTDVCQCKGNVSGDAGLSWQCELNICP